MELKIGKLYINRTSRFLAPLVKSYDISILNILTKLKQVAWGIGDYEYEKVSGKKHRTCLFVLVEKTKLLGKLLEDFRLNAYFVDDYIFDKNCHMLVVNYTDKEAYEKFLKSKYSEMYNSDFITKYINKQVRGKQNEVYLILTKDQSYKKVFSKILSKEFDTDIIVEDDRELDFPLNFEEEVFKWNKEWSI